MNIWEQVLARIETKMNRHSFITWFKPTTCVADDGTQLTILVPTIMFRNWLLKHYAGVMADALAEAGRPGTILNFAFQQAVTPEMPGGSVQIHQVQAPLSHASVSRPDSVSAETSSARGTAPAATAHIAETVHADRARFAHPGSHAAVSADVASAPAAVPAHVDAAIKGDINTHVNVDADVAPDAARATQEWRSQLPFAAPIPATAPHSAQPQAPRSPIDAAPGTRQPESHAPDARAAATPAVPQFAPPFAPPTATAATDASASHAGPDSRWPVTAAPPAAVPEPAPVAAATAPLPVAPSGIVGPNSGAPHISPARMPPTQVVNSNTLHINTSSAHVGPRDAASTEPTTEGDTTLHPAGLNPRYTFETFVVGPSNQFAHAACRAVAEAPARSYNPLYIYGGVGLGKTHLMHAIGHYMLQHGRNLRLTYISSERFMNEMINALRYERILDFRERYRNVDVLLVDDIQFIAGKESTQTEFFHTFNALFDSAKQIVISSDCPPHEITSLEERLRSRFEWGLIADIQPPDLETKVAILKKKADADGMPLPDNVAIYIAGKIKSNIRELEGSLIRLVAYASMTGAEVTLQLAQLVLRNVLSNDERVVTIEVIQKFVAEYYQLKPSELKSRNNSKSIALPRQIAMYLCKNLTKASLPEIGKSFGGKHHSTVIHSIQKIEGMRQADGDFNTHVNNLLMNFQ